MASSLISGPSHDASFSQNRDSNHSRHKADFQSKYGESMMNMSAGSSHHFIKDSKYDSISREIKSRKTLNSHKIGVQELSEAYKNQKQEPQWQTLKVKA
jgi:hypothetical protein